MDVGVIDLQGSVEEHYFSLVDLIGKENVYRITDSGIVPMMDKVIIPGGESTTVLRLMKKTGIFEEIKEANKDSKTIFGTCAGLIALASRGGKDVSRTNQELLGLMDVCVRRNAFGRQKESFEVSLDLDFLDSPFPSIFIRAPAIVDAGDSVDILGKYQGNVVSAREDNLFVTSFHPELVEDDRVYRYFLEI